MNSDAANNIMHDATRNGVRGCMRDADPPALPRPRMPRAQRAKIFIPFDPLKGYQEALREKEREVETRMGERPPFSSMCT